MYVLTIKYLDGSESINSYETLPQVKEHINSIDRLVDSIDMYFDTKEPIEEYNGDETSHNSWGI